MADCSSSLAASSSWMIDWRYSRLAASSCSSGAGGSPRSPCATLPGGARRALPRCACAASARAPGRARGSGRVRRRRAARPRRRRCASRRSSATRSPVAPHRACRLCARPAARCAARSSRPSRAILSSVQARVARRGLEVAPGLAAELDDLQVAVDDDAGRRVALEDDAVGLVLDRPGPSSRCARRLAARRAAGRRGGWSTGKLIAGSESTALLRVDAVLLVGRSRTDRTACRSSRRARASGSRSA